MRSGRASGSRGSRAVAFAPGSPSRPGSARRARGGPPDLERLKNEDMTGTHPEDQPKQPNHINLIAIVAGAAASLSAAVVASFFGVAGTLIGTAVASVVSSLAAAVYAGLLGRTPRLVQRTTTVLHVPPKRAGDRRSPPPRKVPATGSRAPPATGSRAPPATGSRRPPPATGSRRARPGTGSRRARGGVPAWGEPAASRWDGRGVARRWSSGWLC